MDHQPGQSDQVAPVLRNVAAVAELEEAARRERTSRDRATDAISRFLGRPVFLVVQIIAIFGWIAWNLVEKGRPFDPPPFSRLATVLAIEATLLSTFVLISQNRMAATENRRDHLNLQISLLAEAEMTTALRLLREICQRIGVTDGETDAETKALAAQTDLREIARHVDEQLQPDASTATPAARSR